MIRKPKRMCLCFLVSLLLCIGMAAAPGAEEYIYPTLFHNDEVWFKDSLAPLLTKEGIYHVPVEILSRFTGITISYNDEDNILIQGEAGYVSILYSDKTAIVDGSFETDVPVFRQNGYYYVGVSWIAEIFSLEYEYAWDGSGRASLRLTNGEERRTIRELLAAYGKDEFYEAEIEWEDGPVDTATIKRIFIVTGDNKENGGFADVVQICENSGLRCTVFLHSRSSSEKFFTFGMMGNHGICADTAEEAERVNEILFAQSLRRSVYVLPDGEDTDREQLTQAGYVIVEPDFVVNYQTDPDLVYSQLVSYMETSDSAVVQVSGDGCSQRMLALLCDLTANPSYCISDVLLP